MLGVLGEAGARLVDKTLGFDLLQKAFDAGSFKTIQALLDFHLATDERSGARFVQVAVEEHRLDMAKWLVAYGARIDGERSVLCDTKTQNSNDLKAKIKAVDSNTFHTAPTAVIQWAFDTPVGCQAQQRGDYSVCSELSCGNH